MQIEIIEKAKKAEEAVVNCCASDVWVVMPAPE